MELNSKEFHDASVGVIKIKTKGEYQITDAFQLMLERKLDFRSFQIDGWFDCGTPATLLETNRYMLEKEHVPCDRAGSRLSFHRYQYQPTPPFKTQLSARMYRLERMLK